MDPTVLSIAVIGGIGGLSAAFTEFIKRTLIDPHLYKPTDPAHDTFVRGVCFIVALLLTVLSIAPAFPGSGVGWLTLLFQAAASAGISISGYHVVTGSATPATLPGTLAVAESAAPTAADLATALAAALEPLLARLVPVTPARSLTLDTTNQKLVDFPNTNASPPAPMAPAPQSPPPGPATPVAKPAE